MALKHRGINDHTGGPPGSPAIVTRPASSSQQLTKTSSVEEIRARAEADGKRKFGGPQPNAGRKLRLLTVGIGKDNVDGADPLYLACLRSGRAYLKQRLRDYMVNFGHVSTGVAGLLTTSTLAMAASRYLYEKAGQNGDLELLKKAASLGNDSRQNELAAWELCSRESVVARKNEMSSGFLYEPQAKQLQKVVGETEVVTTEPTIGIASNPFVTKS